MRSLSEVPLATKIVQVLTQGEKPLYHAGTSGPHGSKTIFFAPLPSIGGRGEQPTVPEIMGLVHPGFPGTVLKQQTGEDTDPVTIVVERGRGGENATISLHPNSDSARRAHEASTRYDGRGTS